MGIPARRKRPGAALLCALVSSALLAAAGPAAAYTTDTSFTIYGHGWGHGIGMSQWGAYGYAKHGWTYREILEHYYTGISFGTFANDNVRVRLASGLDAVKVSCPRVYTATGGGTSLALPAGSTAVTTYSGGVYHVDAGATQGDFSSPVTFSPGTGSVMRVLTPTDLDDTGPYRGRIRVLRSSGALMMVDSVPLESYLRGVVPHEVPASWPAEALKAQACAARAFVLGSRESDRAWDVYCDVRSQAYMGVGIEDRRTDAAVKDTAGVVPTYDAKPILAVYFSCSGGRTENIEDGWPGSAPVAYLKGVDDPYDYYASLHDWGPLRRTAAQIAKPLAVKGTLRAVYTVKRGTSPRIVKAALITSRGVTFMDGNMLRMKLGLHSTWATFTSMSISPATHDKVTVAPDTALTIKGRIYPALAVGETVRLYVNDDSRWRSREVTATAGTDDLPGTYTARYTAYTANVSPQQTTQYYFKWGKFVSPTTTITVTQAAPAAATAGAAAVSAAARSRQTSRPTEAVQPAPPASRRHHSRPPP